MLTANGCPSYVIFFWWRGVQVMTERNRKVRSLIQKLSKINWKILKKESE
jgi:hypothetical protein